MSPEESPPPRNFNSSTNDSRSDNVLDPDGSDGDRPEEKQRKLKNAASIDPSHPLVQPTFPLPSTYSLLIFATIWGVLARLGLEWIGGFAERQVFAVIWAQIVGCVVMGFVTERKKSIESIFPPLFAMLGTGFCGSLTTWSTMENDTFTAFANLDQPSGTSRFSGFLSGFAITLITLVASICALQFGVHLSEFLPSPSSSLRRRPFSRRTSSILNLCAILIGPLFWLGTLFLVIFGPARYRSRATFAIVFGPFGTLFRFTLSKHLNSLNPRFPFGTFAANVLSTLVFAILGIFARHPTSDLSCAASKGLEDGFCGSLSTVSTLVVELRSLGRRDSYRYFWSTWLASEAFLVVVLGSWIWSGEREGLCWTRFAS
ncbi:FluC/FEX family fluoride channel [Sporobolomyces salmoneus]|uniref:FluC/FEX family fluoride channel n=1 Tax=Sporobolomyces salmoneus TaxID=183962 RepID=UPI003180EFC1